MTMYRFVLITACLVAPVFSNSAGAPQQICSNNLTPEHGVDAQSGPVPYRFDGDAAVRQNERLSVVLSGDDFMGFAVQVRDANEKPIGQFNVVESNNSQTLNCAGKDDTLTHRKLNQPIKRIEFQWTAPKDFKGKAKIVGTVAKNGGTYWVRKVLKEITVA